MSTSLHFRAPKIAISRKIRLAEKLLYFYTACKIKDLLAVKGIFLFLTVEIVPSPSIEHFYVPTIFLGGRQ